jgi:hypothetical protein
MKETIAVTPENYDRIIETLKSYKALHIMDETPWGDQPPYNIIAFTDAMYVGKFDYIFDGEIEHCDEERIRDILTYINDESPEDPITVEILPYSKFVEVYKDTVADYIEFGLKEHC